CRHSRAHEISPGKKDGHAAQALHFRPEAAPQAEQSPRRPRRRFLTRCVLGREWVSRTFLDGLPLAFFARGPFFSLLGGFATYRCPSTEPRPILLLLAQSRDATHPARTQTAKCGRQ